MYCVADGYSFSGKRGILGPGNEITEKDFASRDAFVKAVAKGKIVVGKNDEQLKKEAAERAQKQQEAVNAAAEMEKGKTLAEAENRKEAAAAALKAAEDRLADAQTAFEKADEARDDAVYKATAAREAAAAPGISTPGYDAALKAVAGAEAELEKAKKPADKEAARKHLDEARGALVLAEGANNELVFARKNLAGAEAELEKAETARTENEAKALSAKEAVTLAEAELEKAAAALAALGGK
jgi:colicin import membrane protein